MVALIDKISHGLADVAMATLQTFRLSNAVTALTVILCLLTFVSCSKKPTSFPTIHIHQKGQIPSYSKIPCLVTYIEQNDTTTIRGDIKTRGGFSARFEKCSFSLKLNQTAPLAGLPASDDWILNASYIDKTFMRHKLCFDLFHRFSETNVAPKCSFAEVYVNDDYRGLYLITERLDEQRAGIALTDTTTFVFKEPPIFYEKEGTEDLRNGGPNRYNQQFPEIEKRNFNLLMEDLHDFLLTSSDSQFIAEIASWFDIQSVIDWHLLLLFSNNNDGLKKNFYLYKKDEKTPLRFAPWDYDHSLGRDGDNELNMHERNVQTVNCILLKRLMELNPTGYKKRLSEKWFELRKNNIISVEAIGKMIAEIEEQIQPALQCNFERWPVIAKHYYDSNGFEQEVRVILDFIAIRIPYLDEYFEQL